MVKRMSVVRECNPRELKERKSFGSLRRSARGQSTTCNYYAGGGREVVVRVWECCSCCGDQTSVVDFPLVSHSRYGDTYVSSLSRCYSVVILRHRFLASNNCGNCIFTVL